MTVALCLTLTASLGLAACHEAEMMDPDPDPEVEPTPEYAVRVVGELYTAEIDEAQALHDQIAAGGEEAAMEAGDFGHDAMLGTTLLGTTEDQFLGLDRWTDRAGMTSFYANPDFAEAFGMLFAAPPELEMFEWQPGWHGWGDLTAGDGSDEHFFVVVRGRLAATGEEARTAHDAVASGGQDAALQAGDVAHVVFLALDDPQEYLAFDIWTDDTNLEAFYTDPQFAESVGALFDGPPAIGVYRSTEWHQW